MSWFRARFVLALTATAVLAAGCGSSATSPPAPGGTEAFQPLISPGSAQACALATTNGYNFILVRGGTADNDCQLLLADLAASTVQTWQTTSGQIPPSTSDILYCDLNANSLNRVTVWGSSMQGLGSSICSELQTGVIPAELAAPTPTPVPTVCSFVYDYENGGQTVVIVRGASAVAECASLSGKLPAVDWKLVMGEANVSYRICQGAVGSSSIEVWDTRFSEPPTWTTQVCSEIAAGTLGLMPGGTRLSIG